MLSILDPWKFGCEFFYLSHLKYGKGPRWKTPNKIILETEAFQLRRFSESSEGNPILILPPQAGHSPHIVDYKVPGQSLVAVCLENSLGPVYVIDWKSADWSRRNEEIDDLVKQVGQCAEKIDERLILIGICQGGWLGTIFTSLFPEKVESLILGGAPIDFAAGGGKLQEMVRSLPMSFYEGLVAAGGGLLRGELMVLGFKSLNIYAHYVKKYADLFENIGNTAYLERLEEFEGWYEYPYNIAGAWYLQAVEELFKKNQLVKNSLRILGRPVNLLEIDCPVTLIAGEKDDITLSVQLFNIADHIRTEKVEKIKIPDCGHIGLFMGAKALSRYWPAAIRRHTGYRVAA